MLSQVFLLVLVASVTAGFQTRPFDSFFFSHAQAPAPRDQAVQSRGDHVMGFSHEKTTHHFHLFSDGGEIAVSANDASDQPSITQIRSHLKHIATMFATGNFQAPMLIHDTNPPGAATMAKRKDQIRYTFISTGAGASIRIVSTNAATTDAVHAFLLFQILDHRTNDSPAITSAITTAPAP